MNKNIINESAHKESSVFLLIIGSIRTFFKFVHQEYLGTINRMNIASRIFYAAFCQLCQNIGVALVVAIPIHMLVWIIQDANGYNFNSHLIYIITAVVVLFFMPYYLTGYRIWKIILKHGGNVENQKWFNNPRQR